MHHSVNNKPSERPPRWANHFLKWYCRPELLEEIEGDIYELFIRTAKQSKRKASWQYAWNVIRFFRWRNIRKKSNQSSLITTAMMINIIKVAIRNFLRQPGHSFINSLGLAVSFTAAMLIGLWIIHELSFDKFHERSENIYKIMSHVDSDGTISTFDAARANVNLSSIPQIEQKAIVISGNRWPNELCIRPEGKNNDCVYLNGIFSEQPFFHLFSFQIVKGDPDPLAKPDNIAISETMAKMIYGSEDPLGKIIKVDDHYPVTVASIFKDVPVNSTLQFQFVLPREVFAAMRGLPKDHFNTSFFTTYFKTNQRLSVEELTEKLNQPEVLTEDLKKDKLSYSAFPLLNARLKANFVNGKNEGGRIQYVNLFMMIAILVVAMAIINFVNLSTARATNRAKEIGIRKATGALRSSIVVQFLGESFLVVSFSFAIAAMATYLAIPLFNMVIGESLSVNLFSVEMAGTMIAFLVLVALLSGFYPAMIMSSFQPAKVLKGALATSMGSAQALRKFLLVIQVGTSIAIVIFTGVLFNQISFIKTKNLGLDKDNLLHIEPTYKLLTQYDAFKNELLNYPQIKSVCATNADPINLTSQTTGVSWPGMPAGMNAPFKLIGSTHELQESFKLTLKDGRFYGREPEDTTRTEVLISTLAQQTMGLSDPLGTHIRIGDSECVIIGVVEDFHTESLRQEQLPVILYGHPTVNCSRLYVRYEPGTAAESLPLIESVYKKYEPAFVMKYAFVSDAYDKMYKTESTASVMLIIFTVLSFVIALVGVIGLATFNVVKRRKEIGIKRVFGASAIQILEMLSKEFVILVLISSILAIPAAWYSANAWLSNFAYRVEMPWWIFAVTIVLMTGVTVFIIMVQGIKTIQSNPTESLRSE